MYKGLPTVGKPTLCREAFDKQIQYRHIQSCLTSAASIPSLNTSTIHRISYFPMSCFNGQPEAGGQWARGKHACGAARAIGPRLGEPPAPARQHCRATGLRNSKVLQSL